MWTKYDLLNGNCTHEQYYTQFIAPRIVQIVAGMIGTDWIKSSKSSSFDDIPAQRWLAVGTFLQTMLAPTFSKHGDFVSVYSAIIVAKYTAKIIKNTDKTP